VSTGVKVKGDEISWDNSRDMIWCKGIAILADADIISGGLYGRKSKGEKEGVLENSKHHELGV
jgi:hypothetical protein